MSDAHSMKIRIGLDVLQIGTSGGFGTTGYEYSEPSDLFLYANKYTQQFISPQARRQPHSHHLLAPNLPTEVDSI
jgi:hypothetical protein